MDKQISERITDWIEKNLNGCNDPRKYGKALAGNLKGLWRYRIGDYRIIAEIQDDKLIIDIIETGPRKKIYE
jgi:mRNA interferase RelE/StbE